MVPSGMWSVTTVCRQFMRGKYKKKKMQKRYYKVFVDDLQSIWLIVEQQGKVTEAYTRAPCSHDGPLTKASILKLILLDSHKDKYKRVEISQEEAFVELL